MVTLKDLETSAAGTRVALAEILPQLKFNDAGLVPAIAQDYDSGTVLMMAWMDQHAIEQTLEAGQVIYFSRSRQEYWRKGESSGHYQDLVSMHFDCDGDTVLLKVRQTGAACHTDRPNCFYLTVNDNRVSVDYPT